MKITTVHVLVVASLGLLLAVTFLGGEAHGDTGNRQSVGAVKASKVDHTPTKKSESKPKPVAPSSTAPDFKSVERGTAVADRASRLAAEDRKRAEAAKKAAVKTVKPKDYANGPSGWIQECVDVADVPQSWYKGLYTIASRESSFDPKAYNNWDVNAKNGMASRGLMQTIPSTYEANREPGTKNDIYDPVSNCAAAANYIKGRYGDISNVQQADPNQAPQGY